MAFAEHQDAASARARRWRLARAMPKNAMVSTDIGNVCSVSNSYLHFEQAPSFLAAMSFGNCGYAFPAAIGAKVGRPDRPAIAYVGDGAWGMSLDEVRPACARKFRRSRSCSTTGSGAPRRRTRSIISKTVSSAPTSKNPNFADVAEAMGAEGHHGRTRR